VHSIPQTLLPLEPLLRKSETQPLSFSLLPVFIEIGCPPKASIRAKLARDREVGHTVRLMSLANSMASAKAKPFTSTATLIWPRGPAIP
jgi:hypothetical protein